MAEGTIERLIGNRGFGFIRPGEGGRNVFFHQTSVQGARFDSLREGQRVIYESEMGPKGPRATSVRPKDVELAEQQPPYRFLNPYNFVSYLPQPDPLPDSDHRAQELLWRCPPPPHDRYVGLNGRITCDVEAVTPLFVSDSHAVEVDRHKHKTYRFFEYGDEPALPATSLRGMVRAVFEAVTNSCFAVFDDRRLSYRLPATRASALVPARVEKYKGKWALRLLTGFVPMSPGRRPRALYAATVHLYDPLRGRRTSVPKVALDGLEHGDECYALVEKKGIFTYALAVATEMRELPPPRKQSQQIVKGWLCINNQNVDNKRKERFFFRDPGNTTGPKLIPFPKHVREAYEDLIKDYQLRHEDRVKARRKEDLPLDDVVGSEEALSRYMYNSEDLEVREGTLVYVSLRGSINSSRLKAVFVAPAAVPRVAYRHSTGDLLPYDFLHACDSHNELCPACRVFGWVHKLDDEDQVSVDERVAYAGRVRFTHGSLTVDRGVLEDTTLAILSSPKPTTTRFYLRPISTRPVDGLEDAEAGYDGQNVLRGRKVYRHHDEADPQEYQRATNQRFDGKDDQNRTVRGARQPGTHFKFSIDFHNLAPVELGALLWSLELTEGDTQGYHRLGYAKPLGFGSVKLGITDLEINDPTKRYGSWSEDGWRQASEDIQGWKDLFSSTLGSMYRASFEQLPNVVDLVALVGDPPDLPIHYPRTTRTPTVEGKNFEWFVGNKRSGKNAGPRLALPLADRDDEGLPLLDKSGREVR